jgi:uncharacterized protein (DUF934 family)
MPLIKNRALSEDTWLTLDDESPVPQSGPVIVGLDRWRAEREALLARRQPLGIRLRADQSPAQIADDLRHFAVVALEFPKFADGRAFSYARLLRERYGYMGEVRAVGAPVIDQALFLHRCGFDAIEVPAGTSVEAWLAAQARISVTYQPAADGKIPVYRRHRPFPAAPEKTTPENKTGVESAPSESKATVGPRHPDAAPRRASGAAAANGARWAY